jgi:DNA polymerase I-like protein with 3'-5' exonuclease and polymerase domains
MADVDRTRAKTINLGIMYGMGLGKLATILGGITMDEAREIRDEYDEKVPFIRTLASTVMEQASIRTEIRTLMGRKCRFPMRELRRWSKNNPVAPVHVDKLEERWKDILDTPVEDRERGWQKYNPDSYRVAFTFKSLNRLIQASSADQTKKAMKDCIEAGFWPMLTVHDELCFSIEDESHVAKIKELMENCVPDMQIPSRIDVGIGENWGTAK